MSENNVSAAALTPADIQKNIAIIKNLIQMGRGLAALTPTDVDDKIIDFLDKVVTAIEPALKEEGVVDLINFILELFQKDGPKTALEKIKAALS